MKQVVIFLRDHTVIHPATVLESTTMSDGVTYHVADIPEFRTEYKTGQEVTFRNKRDALAFVKAMNVNATKREPVALLHVS